MNEPLRVLIVDDNEMMVKTLQDILKIKGFQVEVAYSGPQALEKVIESPFDCVLSDVRMPELNGVELHRAVKTQQPNLPVVLMTAYATDKLVQEGLAEGVVAVLNKPLDVSLVLKFLSYLSLERSIVIIDDDPNFGQTLGDVLQIQNFSVAHITQPNNVVDKIGEAGQVVLLDMKLNGKSGLDVLREIRQAYPHMPVILVTGYREEMATAVEAALAINAFTCFYKPFRIDQLLQTLNRIHHLELGRLLGRPISK